MDEWKVDKKEQETKKKSKKRKKNESEEEEAVDFEVSKNNNKIILNKNFKLEKNRWIVKI